MREMLRVWLHHTAGSEPNGAAGMRAIQNFHMGGRGWSDIAYSFVVDRAGVIFEGRGAGVVGSHTRGDNSRSCAICVIGNYEHDRPTEEALHAVAWLLGHGQTQGWWPEARLTGGHRDAPRASTACPGRHLYAKIGSLNRLALNSPTEENENKMDKVVKLINYEGGAQYAIWADGHAEYLGPSRCDAIRRLFGVEAVGVSKADLKALVGDQLHPEDR